jgi:hypothetical protein
MAVVSVVLVAGLLLLAGWHLVVPVALALAALVVALARHKSTKKESISA